MLELTDDRRVLRNGFIIGRIEYTEDGDFKGYSFFPSLISKNNFYLQELRVIGSYISQINQKQGGNKKQ